jgi:hypothetical protein
MTAHAETMLGGGCAGLGMKNARTELRAGDDSAWRQRNNLGFVDDAEEAGADL